MKEYTIIGTIEFEKTKYEQLVDEDGRYFYLRINGNNEYEYITLKELIKLLNIHNYNPNVKLIFGLGKKDKNKKKIRIIPKILLGTALIVLSSSFFGMIASSNINRDVKETFTSSTSYVQSYEIEDEMSPTERELERIFEEIEKENESYEIEKEWEGYSTHTIYDTEALDQILNNDKTAVTYEDIRNQIMNNNEISQKYKTLYINLINNLEEQYPTMDLRILSENLKTLKIVELDNMEMKLKAMSVDACACYRIDENTIYTVKGYDYIPGTWEYQVIIHEMCHPIRSSNFKHGDKTIITQFESKSGNGSIIGESLNSLFSLRSYDKNERDVAYQLQSNMMEVIVDSLDTYTYQDFVEHNITYLENKLNEQNGNTDAMRMFGLMELQYNDYHKDEIDVSQEQFYDLYDYIARMYYDKNIKAGMSREEVLEVEQKLVERITYDVPKEYNIDTNHFLEFLETYCNEKGLTDVKAK